MQDDGILDPEILSEFAVEAKEHLTAIEPSLLELEKTPDDHDLLDTIFRPMHSIKGAASFIGLDDIADLTHKFENLLDELRKGRLNVDADVIDLLFAATDLTVKLIDNLGLDPEEREDLGAEIGVLVARAESRLSGAPAAAVEGPPSEPLAVPGDDLGAVEEHLADFVDEAREIQAALTAELVSLEAAGADPDLLAGLFRWFHNLKGNASDIGFTQMEELTHRAETVLGDLRAGALDLESEVISALLAAADTIEVLLDHISPEGIRPADTSAVLESLDAILARRRAPTEAPAAPESAPEPPAVSSAEAMDEALTQIGDALGALARDPQDAAALAALPRAMSDLHYQAGTSGFPEIEQKAAERLAVATRAERGRTTVEGTVLDDFFTAYLDLSRMVDAVRSGAMAPAGAPPAEPPRDKLVGEILVEEKVATPEQVEAALKAQDSGRRPLGRILTEAGLAEPEAVAKGLQIQAKGRQPLGKILVEDQLVPAEAVEEAARKQKKPKAAPVAETIRVEHAKLDSLMNLIGELIINRNRFSMILKMVADEVDLAEIGAQLAETTTAMGRISDELQDTIMKVRMVPVKNVFNRMPRLVRDLSMQSGKKVNLVIEGEETELDKTVIEEISDPLVHLLRNAVDHGLEAPEQRAAADKPETGTVHLRAYHKGNTVVIEVEDDGRGIDPEILRQKAVDKGLFSAEAAYALDDREALELIFLPGFSTAEEVSSISGRGVGMDVVRSNIRKLKGQAFIESEPGVMTRLSLTLPLTLAIIDALTVIVNGMRYAIPLEAVQETIKVEQETVSSVDQRRAISLRGDVLSVVDLAQLIEVAPRPRDRESLPVVVIGDDNRRLGVVVDEMLERQEIVIKSLGNFLGEIRGLSGATITGDGQVVLILDPIELIKLAQQADVAVETRAPSTAPDPGTPPPSPDDSGPAEQPPAP
ncbi:MAG: chemotaxis protein CheA [Proteobacteria bacterium]|nr:chemotaxis protein CheA [Pseudomonadota bacterium]MBU1742976.1 chemotaxis protein CheA [Pseudomonadota bacterium]